MWHYVIGLILILLFCFERDNELAIVSKHNLACMGRRKLGNLEKSSASFEHEINFGFDYCVIQKFEREGGNS